MGILKEVFKSATDAMQSDNLANAVKDEGSVPPTNVHETHQTEKGKRNGFRRKSYYLNVDLIANIKDLAWINQVPESEVVRKALTQYIGNHKEDLQRARELKQHAKLEGV